MQNSQYKKAVGCLSCCQDVRASKMKSRLSNKKKTSAVAPLLGLLQDGLHILDIFTDVHLAKTMFEKSKMKDADGKIPDDDYNICFVWISLAIFGPYIIQYSSYISLLYHKGTYQYQNYMEESLAKRLCLIISLTWLGLIIIPLMDIMLKLENLVNVLFLPFDCCKCGNQPLNARIRQGVRTYIKGALEMNEFEIGNFKQQSKFT